MSPNRRRFNEPEESAQPDQQAAPQRPDQRTLDALGNAVRRARESSGATGPDLQGPPAGDEPPPREVDITDEVPVVVAGAAAPPPPPRPATTRPPAHRAGSPWYARAGGRRQLPSAGALGGLAVAAVVVVVLVAISLAHALSGSPTARASRGGGGPAPSSTAAPSTGAPSSSATTAPSTTAPPTTQSSSTTSTTTAPATGSGPAISSISPASGGAGSVVVVSGSNLFSSNGVVLARVDGQPSPTSCPTRSSCQVTIPDLGGGARSVPVTISTAAGTSKPLSFHYA